MENDLVDLGPRKKGAKLLAQKLIKDAGITIIPVSLQKIIEYLQKDRSLEVHRINTSDKVSGLLVVCKEIDSEYATIGFNENHHWYKRRFTIAHEIGHLLFGHTCIENRSNLHNEKESDIFAAELLMPTKFIKKDYSQAPDLEKLSDLYKVSRPALTIKLMEARLIK